MKPLPKNRRIEKALEAWCLERKAHDPLPAETALAEKHGASVMLVRQSLARLEARGVLYKVHGRGNFVSPKARKNLLLLVHHDGEPAVHPHIPTLAFALAKAWAAADDGGPLITLGASEVAAMDPDLWHHAFPNLSGIVFFREVEPMSKVLAWNLPRTVPCVFLGSSSHKPLVRIPGRFHEEGRIARLVSKTLSRRRVAVLGPGPDRPDSPVHRERVQAFLNRIPNSVLVDPAGRPWPEVMDSLRRQRPAINALACVHDILGFQALQWAVRCGFKVPGDLAIVGVNGDPGGELLVPSLTTVRLDLQEDARALVEFLRGKPLETEGCIQLVSRESA